MKTFCGNFLDWNISIPVPLTSEPLCADPGKFCSMINSLCQLHRGFDVNNLIYLRAVMSPMIHQKLKAEKIK